LHDASHDEERDWRLPRLRELRAQERQLQELQNELAQGRVSGDIYNGIMFVKPIIERLTEELDSDFMKQHGRYQLISPRSFFTSKLFHVKSRATPREECVRFSLSADPSAYPRFVGPELRQGDGLVFMALLNLCRDCRLGKQVCFDASAMAKTLWEEYNGKQRERLKLSVQRLQRSTIEFADVTVQLVQRFEHPRRGDWRVALDREIVELFGREKHTWLDLPVRLQLREGLTTWLYGYICSQRSLIPTALDALRERCGSDAQGKAFREMLLHALNTLANISIIDSGWYIKGDRVHWRKPLEASKPASMQRKKDEVVAATAPVAPEQASLPYDEAAEELFRPSRRRS
jgi:hypothetical protein